jgi:hypothetical protein
MNETRDYYKVMLVGQSGKGKTFSARNMDPNTTGFINIENKPLPFKNSFKYHARPKTYTGALKALEDYAANPEIDCIFIDSFSGYIDLLLEGMREKYKGYDIWSNYNQKIGEFFKKLKDAEKEVFVNAHYESLSVEADKEKRVKVKGKEWEGVVEKEFTVVLYADSRLMPNGKYEYFFVTAGEGVSAKCPPGLFGDKLKLDNDCNMLLEMIHKFVGVEQRNKSKELIIN